MNKYYIRIPHSFTRQDNVIALVNAESFEEAKKLARDKRNWLNQGTEEDSIKDSNENYHFDKLEVFVVVDPEPPAEKTIPMGFYSTDTPVNKEAG